MVKSKSYPSFKKKSKVPHNTSSEGNSYYVRNDAAISCMDCESELDLSMASNLKIDGYEADDEYSSDEE